MEAVVVRRIRCEQLLPPEHRVCNLLAKLVRCHLWRESRRRRAEHRLTPLQGLHEGKITSKREGAKWAKQHLDAQWHALIDCCWQERQDTGINVSQPADPRAFQRTVAFSAYTTRLAEEYQLPKD
jgi:hypothetical protein